MKKLIQKFKNLSRSKKIVVITCSVLVLLLAVSVPTAIVLSTDKKEVETSSKKTIKSKSKNNKEKKDKEEVDQKDDDKKEESTSKDDDSKKSDDKNETTQETSKQSTNSNGSSSSGNSGGNTSSTPAQQPQQSAPQPAPTPQPQTAWEKLGISEYAYYNTTLEGVQPDFKGSDLSVCESEVRRLRSTYITQGLSGGGAYTVTGKYTGQYLGCGIRVYINGNTYSYSQAKAMGFN